MPPLTRQEIIDEYNRLERHLERTEADARRTRNRMMRLAVHLVGTEPKAGRVFDVLMGRDPQLQASRTTVDAEVSGICTYCGKPHDECEARS
jgi:hypothetical protein